MLLALVKELPSLSIYAAASHTESTAKVSFIIKTQFHKLIDNCLAWKRREWQRILTALIVSEANLSADLLVELHHEDFGAGHGNFA